MNPPASRPTLFLIAGPNGAGKTTFYETALAPRISAPFINADIIQRDELKDPTVEAAYRAARVAQERRQEALASRESFVTETVFSHPSKLQLLVQAREAGFRLVLFHLHVRSAELAIARVRARVEEGGHPVPEQKIRERHQRNQELIRAAMLMADRGSVYDASRLNQAPTLLARTILGRADFLARGLPDWFAELYGGLMP